MYNQYSFVLEGTLSTIAGGSVGAGLGILASKIGEKSAIKKIKKQFENRDTSKDDILFKNYLSFIKKRFVAELGFLSKLISIVKTKDPKKVDRFLSSEWKVRPDEVNSEINGISVKLSFPEKNNLFLTDQWFEIPWNSALSELLKLKKNYVAEIQKFLRSVESAGKDEYIKKLISSDIQRKIDSRGAPYIFGGMLAGGLIGFGSGFLRGR